MNISSIPNNYRRPLKWVVYVVGFVLLIIFISWLAVPYFLKKTISEQSESQLGRQATVEKITFNPFTLSVNLSNFVLFESDKKTPAFSVDNIALKASFSSAVYFAPIVREIFLTHPSLNLVLLQREGRRETNFNDVIAWLAKHPSKGETPQFSVSNIQLTNGEIFYDDQIVGKKTHIEAITIGLPFVSNFPKAVDVYIEPRLSAKVDGALFDVSGKSKPFIDTRETKLAINFDKLELSKLAPFSPVPLPVKIDSAQLSSKLSLNFIAPKNIPTMTLSGTARLENVAVSDLANKPLLKVKRIKNELHEFNLMTGNGVVNLIEIDEPQVWPTGLIPTLSGAMSAKKIAIEHITVKQEQKQAKIEKVTVDRLQGSVSRSDSTIKHSSKENKQSSPWSAEINQIVLEDSNLVFSDTSKKTPINVEASAINAKIEQVSTKLDRPIHLAMHAILNKTGKVAVDGKLDEDSAQLKLELNDFPIVALQPYFTDYLNITLQKGALSTEGNLTWTAPTDIGYQGKLTMANFTSSDKETTDAFLNWKQLKVEGIDVHLGAKRQTITAGKIDLSDFYARAILSDQAKLNLSQILVQNPNKSTEAANSPAAPAAPAAPAIKIGQINLHNGVINYTDNYIKPRFTMRMTKMNGSVGALQSTNPQPAPINLNGKLNDDAPVAISGAVNPLAKPLILDIKMTANGIDLPPLTHYSKKYAGYPIEKGKLSLDVEYHVKDNNLSATNSLKLDQLTLGNKVDTPGAPDYPLPFLLSLLADRNGQINLDIPISGSINDPQFSLGAIIGKAVLSIIGKAITAPFSLLANVFSGSGKSSEDLGYVEFAPGTSTLTDASKKKLSDLAKALEQREKLKLDIIGRADMDADSAGLRQSKLNRQIRKANELREGDSGDQPISDADRASGVAKIYSDAKFDKPRNRIGLTKSLPTAEMERMIIANMVITNDDMIALANRRAAAVRTYLSETEHVPFERMYSVAPKIDDKTTNSKAAPSRVDFDLKM